MGIRIVENGCLILGVECIELIGFFVWKKKGGGRRKEERGGEFNYEVERVATKKKNNRESNTLEWKYE